MPLSTVLNFIGINSQARYIVFFAFDDFWDSLDLADAFHPQTFLAYGMNNQGRLARHGAPLRLRVARQLGHKSVKYLSHILVTDTMKHVGKGLGSGAPEVGYSWYAGI